MFGDLFISGLRQSLNRVLGEGSGCELAFMVHFFFTSGNTEVEGDISFLLRCVQGNCTGSFIFVVKGWEVEEGIGAVAV